ncbi:MAG: RagB/SusD family nutrient uptake outer membrane protein [Saprospiraceae bacterium]|nr:RagB/SusD family nutrient uptake outer membrane protein [Saprospiraceae bacterium]MCB0676085.1 RagB/SusD family nutrient uptake outer membrane protein [Saprospiraceae bacterium]MCB0681573.1 RagB/SusD family nutrient uptake outer membrane protein [Saprospiraceae bacterium]
MINRIFIKGRAVLLLAVLFTFSQCTNLDEEIYSELTAENFPTTEEQFISALGAAYTSLYFLLNHNSIFSLNQVSSDEGMIPQRGSDWFDGGQWIRVHRHNYTPNEESVNNGWNALYAGVNDCNRVIDLFTDLVDEGKVDPDQAAGFISELRTLRALLYFWLLDGYGNVPIVTSFKTAEATPATRSRADVYAFVEQELSEAVPNLAKAKDGTTYARFNYYAGKALQAKLYLNAEVYTGTARWAECVAACDEIINSGLYDLEADYFTNFNTDNSGSAENIFVIPYDEAQAQGFNLAQMTLHYSSQATFELQEQPWNGYCTLQEFYNSYDDTDLRKGEWGNQKVRGNFHAGPQYESDGVTQLLDSSSEADDPDGQGVVFTPEVNALEPNALRQAGARIGKYEFALKSTQHLNNDFPVLRYADILLTKAEALWRDGKGSEGLPLVNDIRDRADQPDFGDLNADNLLAERGREMFWEGWRRQDLIRFGKFGEPWAFKDASDECKELFPIPANQIAVNPNLDQNPCY